jgi:hypothetical protein
MLLIIGILAVLGIVFVDSDSTLFYMIGVLAWWSVLPGIAIVLFVIGFITILRNFS